MSKRVLMVATVAATIGSFNMENIRILQELGCRVDVAADFTDLSVWSKERLHRFKKQLEEIGVGAIQLDFSRSPLRLNCHLTSYKEAVKLLQERKYSFIHTHTPIASAVMRLAARKTGTKVIYTAHGFHFYDGAPLKNWLIFYPVEKYLSQWTDVLITINQEDYKRAKKNLKAKRTVYIPGVGINTKSFGAKNWRNEVRFALGLNETDIMLLSVGELNANKNQEIVIKAFGIMKARSSLPHNIFYMVAGKGEKEAKLKRLIAELELGQQVKLIGYCSDIARIYGAADIFVFPSYREGLPVALMEAMASGLPVACSKIRGNIDLIDENGGSYFEPSSVESVIDSITYLLNNRKMVNGSYNQTKIQQYSIECINNKMREEYKNFCKSI